MKLACLASLAAFVLPFPTGHAGVDDTPVELGCVSWMRDHDAAFARAGETGKPVCLVFQEIPGCATCVAFGRGPLSTPLLVDAIESEFVPLAIHNNAPGEDAAVLKRYGEPSWNNPVMRFFAPDGSELLPRKDRVWEGHAIATRLVAALEKAKRPVPEYLRIALTELDPTPPTRLSFAMHCYWKGEAVLGGLEGVRSTRAAWRDGLEVVDVEYDPRTLSTSDLVRAAMKMDCAQKIYAFDTAAADELSRLVGAERVALATGQSRTAKESDQLYHLNRSPYARLALSPLQARRVNSALEAGRDASAFLSPRQLAELEALRSRNEERHSER